MIVKTLRIDSGQNEAAIPANPINPRIGCSGIGYVSISCQAPEAIFRTGKFHRTGKFICLIFLEDLAHRTNQKREPFILGNQCSSGCL